MLEVYQKQVEEEELENKKKELEEKAMLEVQMEKLKLAKEQRCILQSQADIIKNTRKAMKDVEVDRDVLVGERSNFKIFLRTRKIMVMHSNERGECCLRTLVDRKRKRYNNVVDVVVRVHDPTNPSTVTPAPPSSWHTFSSMTHP